MEQEKEIKRMKRRQKQSTDFHCLQNKLERVAQRPMADFQSCRLFLSILFYFCFFPRPLQTAEGSHGWTGKQRSRRTKEKRHLHFSSSLLSVLPFTVGRWGDSSSLRDMKFTTFERKKKIIFCFSSLPPIPPSPTHSENGTT